MCGCMCGAPLVDALSSWDGPPVVDSLSGGGCVGAARVSVFMSVHRLKHGYLGYNGHIINVAQDACILYVTIPRKWDNLELVSFVKEDQKGNKRTMKVNKDRVVAACHWLKTYNSDYADVVIDASHLPEVYGLAALVPPLVDVAPSPPVPPLVDVGPSPLVPPPTC